MNKTELREINAENFWQILRLKVAENQLNFVATNAVSIAESKYFPFLLPPAIYAENEPVGFTLYGRDPALETYWIVRLMIAEKFQGKGYGKNGMQNIIEKMSNLPDCDEVFLSVVPENISATKFYENFGFKKTGDMLEGEIVMRFDLQKKQKSKTGKAHRSNKGNKEMKNGKKETSSKNGHIANGTKPIQEIKLTKPLSKMTDQDLLENFEPHELLQIALERREKNRKKGIFVE